MHSEQQAAPPRPLEPVLSARPRRRLSIRLIWLFVGTSAVLVLGEAATRLAVAVTHRIPIFVSDARAGWANRRNLQNERRVGDGGEFTISTDAEGHRLTRAGGEPLPADGRALILAGDSFCLGQGVNDAESYAWLLSHELSRKVVNLGVFGYGTEQQLIGLAQYLEAHPTADIGDVVVLVLDNDMRDVEVAYQRYLGRSKPCFKVSGGRLVQPPYEPSWSDHLMDVSYLYWLLNGKRSFYLGAEPPADSVAGIETVLSCLAAMREMATSRGARFHVVAHHYLGRPVPFPESAWQDFVHRANATDMTPRLREAAKDSNLRAYDGGHWNAAGHRLVAQIIKELLGAADATQRAPRHDDSTERR